MLIPFLFTDLFSLVTDENKLMDHKQLGLLLHDSLQVKKVTSSCNLYIDCFRDNKGRLVVVL